MHSIDIMVREGKMRTVVNEEEVGNASAVLQSVVLQTVGVAVLLLVDAVQRVRSLVQKQTVPELRVEAADAFLGPQRVARQPDVGLGAGRHAERVSAGKLPGAVHVDLSTKLQVVTRRTHLDFLGVICEKNCR